MAEESLERKISSGMFWKFADTILTKLVAFVVTIVLARLLLPHDYGIVAMSQICISIADVFVSNGLNTSLVQKKDADRLDFTTIFYCCLAMSLVLYGILFAAAPLVAIFYHEDLLVKVLRVQALQLPLQALNSIQQARASWKMEFRKYFFASFGGTIGSGFVGVWMAYKGMGVWALLGQNFTNLIVDSIVMAFVIDWLPHLEFSWKRAKPLIGFGWKIVVSRLIGVIFNNVNSLIIGRKYDAADLAYYNKGENLPNLVSNELVNTITAVLFPAMSKVSDDKERLKNLCSESVRMISYVVCPFMCGLMAIAEPLIRILYTDRWIDSVPFLRIVCLGGILSTIEASAGNDALLALGRSDITLRTEFIKKPLYILVLILAMPHGVLAIAATVPICSAIAAFVDLTAAQKHTGYSVGRSILDAGVSILLSAVMGSLVYLVTFLHLPDGITIVIQIFLGIAVYIGLSKVFHIPMLDRVKKMVGELIGKFRRK